MPKWLKSISRKKIEPTPSERRAKDFIDMTVPGVLEFKVDHILCGNTFRSVWAIREYPTATDEKAILRGLGEKGNVTLHVYSRSVGAVEERRMLQNATNKHKMDSASSSDISQSLGAEAGLEDVKAMIKQMRTRKEPLLHCAVFIELVAADLDGLKLLQEEVYSELTRAKINVDKLMLRQQPGFLSVMPGGANRFGSQFERALPASSVANLYPFNYCGKTDEKGFYIGKDRFGSNILVDINKREDDRTNSNILILGNSGQGKSFLMKLLLCNLLESGKSVACLDPELEYVELCEALGGCHVDLMGGKVRINPLQPKVWDLPSGDSIPGKCVTAPDGSITPTDDAIDDAPAAFRQSSRLSQHISFLKDFFKSYKDFSDREVDVIELQLSRLYARWGFGDATDYAAIPATGFPVLADLYGQIEAEYKGEAADASRLYTRDTLRDVLLGLHSMCKGPDSLYFNGHTNVPTSRFVVFGVKQLLQSAKNLRDTLLFNTFSYMSDLLLTGGNAVGALDELYLFLTNPVAIEYIRGFMKRNRKRDSLLILASQNLEDFMVEGIRELTKPLFSIPAHVFLFNAGNTAGAFYMENLQIEESEYRIIGDAQQGHCLYKCGNERYNLDVVAPQHKKALFGKAGGA